jgi:hypothetical protein
MAFASIMSANQRMVARLIASLGRGSHLFILSPFFRLAIECSFLSGV